MTECQRCLYTTAHPFGLTIDDEGICSGCRVHDEKFCLDWSARLELLERRIRQHPCRSKFYDCVVPVRGTPEYFFLLDVLVNQLELRPLLVAYNSQFNSPSGIQNVDLMRETFDLDIEIYASNPATYRKLVRESLARHSSVRWPLLAGFSQFPVRVAVDKGIPIVVWPYHQPTEQVGMHSYLEENEMSRRDRHEFDLMALEPQEFVSSATLVRHADVADLRYPTDQELARTSVRGLYMANYLPWDSRTYSEDAIHRFGAVPATNPRTYDPYDRIDDITYMTAHDLLKFAKLGYSRVTDTLVQEIRFGRIERGVATEIRDAFSHSFPTDELNVFLEWLGISQNSFLWLLRRLPFGDALAARQSSVRLTLAAETFLAGFVSPRMRVHIDHRPILFGKGLEV